MKTLVHPAYFPSIVAFSVLVQKDVVWEAHDNFQKQTYRSRCYISTDQGMHMLNIPIKHIGGNEGRQKYSEVKIDNSANWQKQHWRTLETAYRTSPFFEYYEDDVRPLFETPEDSLFQLNLKSIQIIANCLGLTISNEQTTKFEVKATQTEDARSLVHAKGRLVPVTEKYDQVFGERHGFLPNLSVLDLLFNEGTNALTYLKNQSLDFLNA